MVWLALVALTVWLVVQQNNLGALKRELSELRRRLPEPEKAPAPSVSTGITPAMEAAARAAAESAIARPTVAPIPETEPLPAAETVEVAQFTPLPPPPAARPPPPPLTRGAVERWLAENGLAWIGGSALVVGGAFLVGYAAQRGLFTPQMRILAAAVLALALIGAGELLRRRKLAGFGENRLAAAIVTGAGAAMLYGTVWAAFDLYGFITGGVCAGLLAIIAWSLLGLAFLHGEALAALAIGGAFVVPLISGGGTWSTEALTIYLAILIIAGVAIAWMRAWPVSLWATLAGSAVWALLGTIEQESLKALLLGLEPLGVMAVLAFVRPRAVRGAVGPGAVIVASLASLLALTMAYSQGSFMLEGVIAAVALPGFAAALQRRGQAPAWILAAPGVAFTLAAAAARLAGEHSASFTEIWCLQVLALDVASLWAAWGGERRAMSGVGALSSLALALVAGAGIGVGTLAPVGPAIACLALALGALRLATDRSRPTDRRALELWSGGSAAALLAAIALGLSWRWAALGFALATLALALLGRRLKWRSIAGSAAAGAGLGLASLLTPAMLGHALGHGWDAGFYLGVAIFLAAASFFAARMVAEQRAAAEALRTVSPLAALVGAFVFLRWAAGGGTHLDALTEASIRTFLIADAGLASLARLPSERTGFARWRGHALMAAAALHGLIFQVLLYNPRIGFFGDTASGPQVFDSLALAFAAPAVVFGAAAWRIYRQEQTAARVYAVIALVSAVTWAFLEIRRLVHGPHLSGGLQTVGTAESVACSLVLLGLAALIARLRPAGEGPAHPLRHDFGQLTSLFRWLAIAFAVLMAGLWSNPCWGADPVQTWPPLMAILAGYGLIVGMIGRLALDADRAGKPRQAELASDAAIVMGLVLSGLIVRAAFHGIHLSLSFGVSELETWSYSAVAAILGLAFVVLSRRGGRLFLRAGLALLLVTAAKVFIVDTASLSGVVRAGSFLALGVLLLLGALTARRIGRGAAQSG